VPTIRVKIWGQELERVWLLWFNTAITEHELNVYNLKVRIIGTYAGLYEVTH